MRDAKLQWAAKSTRFVVLSWVLQAAVLAVVQAGVRVEAVVEVQAEAVVPPAASEPAQREREP